MKRYLVSAVLLILLLVLTGSTFASENEKEKNKMERAELNLLTSLESDNYGVRTSAAMILGDIKSTKAVIPLMRLLKSSDDERTRIIAALSLYKIGSPMGLFTVSRSARFDESARVRKLCTTFYNEYYIKDMNNISDFKILSDYATK